MKKSISALILMLFLPALAFAQLQWAEPWEKALDEANKAKKPVFFDFYTDWCPHCQELFKTTLQDPKMIEYFNKEGYVTIKVNPEKDKKAETTFKVYAYPTLVIFRNGVEVDRILGGKPTAEMIAALEDIKKDKGTLNDFLRQYKKDPKNAKLTFDILDKYIAKGEFSSAALYADKILTLDKKNEKGFASQALMQKGYIYYKAKDLNKAVEALTSIAAKYPQAKEAEDGYLAAASYSKRLKDTPKAISVLKSFLTKFPNSDKKLKVEAELKRLQEPPK
ncbi:MAG TPA: thioredoxin domain-containing protein [Candidatus Aminicenantes bacterium]|nr:thioredoxin domain-containing protein [Candidatus Aminicenantes bacterium]